MATVRDRLWIWTHQAGSYDGLFGLPGPSRITATEAARWLGVPNLIYVVMGNRPQPPFEPHAEPMRDLDRVIWSIVGDKGSTRNNAGTDLQPVLDLAGSFPNVVGAVMDDFFCAPRTAGRKQARYSLAEVRRLRRRLHEAPRPLELWVVVYASQLDRPIGSHLRACDVATFWSWRADELPALEANFARLERLAPRVRKVLGCYMWDFGAGKAMPVESMARQCEQGLRWLREGRIEGIILVGSCLCDLPLEAVRWTRDWVARVGDEPLLLAPGKGPKTPTATTGRRKDP